MNKKLVSVSAQEHGRAQLLSKEITYIQAYRLWREEIGESQED